MRVISGVISLQTRRLGKVERHHLATSVNHGALAFKRLRGSKKTLRNNAKKTQSALRAENYFEFKILTR
ncbi:hypothetical protein DBY68_019605 [Pseudocitrobacter sp. RIT415]|nr:hypothetical protein DBY68_019605 [Pseudocitrobacter sp. RIT 415]